MLVTNTAKRIKEVRAHFKYKNQKQLADVLGVKQASVSLWESGGNLRMNNLNLFEEKLGVSKAFLLCASDEMFLPGRGVVNEPRVKYARDIWSEEERNQRFIKAVKTYMEKNDLKLGDLSEKWKLNYTHIGNVLNGFKSVSIGILVNAMRYGNININHVLGGVGGFYISEADMSADNRELLELLREEKNIRDKSLKKERA